jgi:hypothetical protein
MTTKQRELVDFLDTRDEWVPIAIVRQQFAQKTIDTAIELKLVLWQDGFIASRALGDGELDVRAARLDQLMNQSVARRMRDCAVMRGEMDE